MKSAAQLLLRTLVSFGLFYSVANQVCNEGGYVLINEPRRSTQAVYNETVDNPLCDYGINEGTWFRFSSYAGIALVERQASDPVPMLRCGTQGPIYIRGLGSHPVTDNTSTTATVCANYGGNACNWNASIQIYKCPGYFLYKLKAPSGCSISYCVGEGNPCNLGDFWNGQSCVSSFPAMKGFPIFSGPHVNGTGLSKEIYFRCQVQYDRQPNDSNARFRVTFLFDGQPLEFMYIVVNSNRPPERLVPTILTPNSLVAVLDEFHLRGRLGKEISCRAESYWNGTSNVQSNLTSVGNYYPAFESTVNSYRVSLTNGSTFNVTFKSTVPFTCSHCKSYDVNSGCCKYRFRMSDYNASSVQCFLLWTGGDTAAVTVYFVPGSTQEGKSFALVFEPYNDDEVWGLSLWRNYVIPPVPMVIVPQSSPYKMCTSVTDPHLNTFDYVSFNNFMVGDFYLAKVTSATQHMEIQVRQEICFGVSCNCGVIVREGNSAFKISVCDSGSFSPTQRYPTVVRLLTQDPADSSTVYTDGTGLIFSVRMPSGLRVEVEAKAPYFSLYVYLPPEYNGKTDSASMCGNSNGNRNDDSINSEQFRIADSLSYFSAKPVCSSKFNVAATRCGCNITYPICSNSDPNLATMSMPKILFPGQLTSGIVCRQTPVAAMASSQDDSSNSENDFILDDDILFPPYTYDPKFGVNVSYTWPTKKGKTEQDVEQYCANMLQSSPAYVDCNAHADIALIIATCKGDVQILDDWISASAYASAFGQDCLNKIAASINSSSDSSSSNSTLEALSSVAAKLCPNQCSGHGTCSEGNCICTTGYIGADCSIDQSMPPSLTGIIRGGVCDVRARPCDVISVFGSGAVLSSALKCRFTDQNTGAHVETKGTLITAVEYSCPVPETTTHRRRRSVTTRTTALSAKTVSITVDGVLYSNVLDFVLFDSVCMECSSSDTCRQTDSSCLIGGECFADGAVNPDDSCLQCVPGVSRNSLTNITVVKDWSPCSGNCDNGVKTRNTACGPRITNEVEFCRVSDCHNSVLKFTSLPYLLPSLALATSLMSIAMH